MHRKVSKPKHTHTHTNKLIHVQTQYLINNRTSAVVGRSSGVASTHSVTNITHTDDTRLACVSV